MGELEDAIRTLIGHQTNTNKLLAYYLQHQLKKQDETPETSSPAVFNLWNVILPTPQALQIIPFNPSRNKIGLANTGPSDIIYHTQWFDPLSVLQYFSDPNDPDSTTPGYNQAIPIGYLAAGMNVDIISVRGVWAYSLGSTADSDQNAILSIQDSVYKVPHSDLITPAGSQKGALKDMPGNPPNTDSETTVVYK